MPRSLETLNNFHAKPNSPAAHERESLDPHSPPHEISGQNRGTKARLAFGNQPRPRNSGPLDPPPRVFPYSPTKLSCNPPPTPACLLVLRFRSWQVERRPSWTPELSGADDLVFSACTLVICSHVENYYWKFRATGDPPPPRRTPRVSRLSMACRMCERGCKRSFTIPLRDSLGLTSIFGAGWMSSESIGYSGTLRGFLCGIGGVSGRGWCILAR